MSASRWIEPVVRELGRDTAPCVVRARPSRGWLEPALVCDIRCLASSRHDLRHAVFVRVRPDKPWRQCESEAAGRLLEGPRRITLGQVDVKKPGSGPPDRA